QDFTDARSRLRGHLLDSDHHHYVVNTGGDFGPGVEKCRAARRACGLDASGRDALNTKRSRNGGREAGLADEGGTGEISQVKRLDLCRRNVAVGEALLACFDRKGPQIAIREHPERRLAHTDHGNWSHTSKLAPPDGWESEAGRAVAGGLGEGL